VIFETDKRGGREADDVRIDHDVADEASFSGFRAYVDEADAWEALSLRRLVVVAQELVAAAHRQHDGACCDRSFQGGLLVLEQVLVDERLLAVLAAAEEEDVDLVHFLCGSAAELE